MSSTVRLLVLCLALGVGFALFAVMGLVGTAVAYRERLVARRWATQAAPTI